ncbi:MAG: tetratricopeptide repeat protein [Acidobacteria bacterium]|nr:tetratricopeptide repeat protein [Acidobacteriota bacterium]
MNYQRLWKPCLAAALMASYAMAQSKPAPKVDKASAYYNYAMAHLYSELAQAYGNKGDYLTTAIEHYRAAIKADPGATFLAEELSDLYIQTGQIRSAVSEAEDALKVNPDDLNARRVLGRIYSRMIGDRENNRINETMVKKAIEQYEKIAEKAPKDVDTWLMLGRLHKVAQSSPESEKAYKKALELDPENEDASVGLAMVYADLGDNKTAAALLEKATRKNPNLRTLTTLASSYEQMRDYKLAAETLRRAVDLAPGNTDLKRAYAQNLLFSDQLDESVKAYLEVVDEEPKDTQSWLRLSQVYRQQRKFGPAREAGDKARALEPTNLEIKFNDVSLLEAEGKRGDAINTLKELLTATAKRNYTAADKTNRLVLLERLGLLYRQNEQPTEAVAIFRQMMELEPENSSRAWAQVIETYRGARDFKAALTEADGARQKFPQDRMIKLIRANLLAEVGRGDEAAKDVRSLLDGKGDREVYLSLAQIYEKSKNYAEMGKAIDEAEKLTDSAEDRENLFFMRGAMLEKLKKFDAAEAEFRKVLAANPENSSALNYLGYMLADRNVRVPEALEMIQKALARDPDNGAYLDSLGWALFRLDRLKEAETALNRAIDKAPHDPTVHEHLGDVYAKQGRVKEAIGQWERSLGEWKATGPSEQDPTEIGRVQKKVDSAKVRQAKETGPAAPKP